MTVTEADIQAFAQFAREQAAEGATNLSMSELASRWQAAREREAVNSAIRESQADMNAGRTERFSDAQDRFRHERNLPSRP